MLVTPDNPSIDWDTLLARFQPLAALADCPQDPTFHGEGDVLTHTRMVVEALRTGEAWRTLDEESRTALFWSALLHDIAKPQTTREEGGRIVSPGHAVKGARTAQRMLYPDWPEDLPPVPFALRQQIVSLVRYHGLPLWFWDKTDMVREVISASQQIRCDWIALLAEADVRGRLCDDQPELLERVDLFREFCAEQDCLNQPYAFPSDHSRFLYFHKAGQHPTYAAYDDTTCEVTLLAGLPGAGKDTWLRDHLPDVPTITLDDLRQKMGIGPEANQGTVVAQAKELAREYLRQNQSFAWNATNVTREIRTPLIGLFASYKARVRLVYMEVPWSELLRRNQTRAATVPEAVLHKLAHRLEVPSLKEAQQVEWHWG